MLTVIQCGATKLDSHSGSLPHLDKKGMTILLKILDTPRECMRI